jgi:hypothetical protein
MYQQNLQSIAKELNQRSSGYTIGGLQRIRVQLKGLSHASFRTIFSAATTFDNWAFHHGGRSELQFNIGFESLDGVEYLRHGVAFSLETSRSLPSIDVLVPKMGLFNEFMRRNEEAMSGFQMWHFRGSERFPSRSPGAITPDLIEKGVFIFLGALQRRDEIDYARILSDFDRLLPLYRFVESGGTFAAYRDSPQRFQFRAGHHVKRDATTSTRTEVELSVVLRHNALQQVLFDELCKEHGKKSVGTEIANGSGGRIDAVVRTDAGYIYFEIKVGQSLQACIRDAIGQLLEYSFWPGSQQAASLVIVGEPSLDNESRAYLKRLQETFSIPVKYRRVVLP